MRSRLDTSRREQQQKTCHLLLQLNRLWLSRLKFKNHPLISHNYDGDLRTQFSAGMVRGQLGHADFKKEEIGRMLNDPDVKTINGHEVWRYKYNYDKAEYEALQRGATPEQAQLVASERTQQVMARVEMAQERAELRQQPYIREVNTHFDKLGQLRDARVQGLEARAKLENREYRGPAPKPPTERQV